MKIIAKHCPTNRDKEKTYSENEFVVQVALLDRESNVIHLPLYVALETEDIADEFTETFKRR